MTKWHAHVVHMAKNMNMVGALGPGPPKSGADCSQGRRTLGQVRCLSKSLLMFETCQIPLSLRAAPTIYVYL